MATANQIFQLVNDSAKQAMGMNAITVKDTASLVSLGDQVLSSTANKDAFYQALVDRIGRTVIAIRQYTAKDRSVKRDEMDWGIFYQKISYKTVDAKKNESWDMNSVKSPYDITPQTEAVQSLFSVLSTYEYADSIPDYQLFTAFTNASAMGAFISGIYVNMDNHLALAEENLANLAIATNIAGVMVKGKSAQKRNLLKEYNDANSTSLTIAKALEDVGFLKFASKQIAETIGYMKNMGVTYNSSTDIPRHTPEDKAVVEVLNTFAKSAQYYLEADTYHNDLVSLPRYEEVNYWQAPGVNGYAFGDISKIHIQNSSIQSGKVEQGGIIAFVHDIDSCASIIYRRRDYTKFNEETERLAIMQKADKGMAVDLTENAVVFYLEEEANSGD